MLYVKLLGPLELSGPAGRIELSSAKLAALLAYLVLAGPKGATRDTLTSLLWGSHFEEQARQNFRQALFRLRKIAGETAIAADDQNVRLAPDTLSTDIEAFESLARQDSEQALRKAVTLYGGELLAGIDIKEAEFESWLAGERRRLAQLFCDAVQRLGDAELAQGAAAAALDCAETVIRHDPFREDAHRLAMRALAALGRRSDALKHYQTLRDRLSRELQTAPEPATIALHEEIRGGVAPPQLESLLRDKPSIAVMPFANLSMDPEQDYFADGMVDEIITALSRFHWLFVISRNSTFAYKGKQPDARQVCRELGVRYVLEGSVRKAGERVRIGGQLIDAEANKTMWADRFEGELKDVFDLQDQVTAKVVLAIAPRLEQAEIERAARKPTNRLDAYDHYLQGLSETYRWTRPSNNEALKHFYRAIELDRRFAAAYGMAARLYSTRKVSGWMDDEDKEAAEAEGLARLAVEFGRDDPVALGAAGMGLAYVNCRLAEGGELIERALALNPNFAWAWVFSGWVKNWMGDSDEAITRVNRAISLSPNDPYLFGMHRAIAFAHFVAGRYEQAIADAAVESASPQAYVMILGAVASSAAHLGRIEQAQGFLARLLLTEPRLRGANLRWWFPLGRDEDFARLAEGLRLAGLHA